MSEPNDFSNQSPDRPQPPWQQPDQSPPPPPFQAGPQVPPPYYYMPMHRPTNSKAVASMILGILSIIMNGFAFVLGPIALILARQARNEIRTTGEGGDGYATTGKVTAIIGLCFFGAMLLFIIIIFALGISHHHPHH